MAAKTVKSKLAVNRKALRDYTVLEHYEAGIELKGTEVKSIREGHTALTSSYAGVDKNQLYIFGMSVPAYEFGNRFNHDPDRPRRLLLHKAEILKLRAQVEKKGHTIIPLGLYLKRGKVKVDLGVCKGKQNIDKRETLKKRTSDREAAREMKNR